MADLQALTMVLGHSRDDTIQALRGEIAALHKAAAERERAAQVELDRVRQTRRLVNYQYLELVERIEELHAAYEDEELTAEAVVALMMSAIVEPSDTEYGSDETDESHFQPGFKQLSPKRNCDPMVGRRSIG